MHTNPSGCVGLGLRRSLMDDLLANAGSVDFLELAPENWMNIGGAYAEQLAMLRDLYPMTAHGLSLSIGSPDELDLSFVRSLADFLDRHDIADYSDHLSYCSAGGHLYDLLPMPFNRSAVRHVAKRVAQVQSILGRRIALENVSYYGVLDNRMTEAQFVLAVLEEADCDLLLDVNNVYVNASNHGYDAEAFIDGLPVERIRGYHVAGHHQENTGIVDTHGAHVVPAVWQLLRHAYARFGVRGTVLERDFDIPPLDELLNELNIVHELQAGEWIRAHA